jgi:hypothetical protein
MFKAHESMVVAGADPRVLNAMSLGLLLNFQRYDAALDPRITFTRASSATYFDSTGTLQTAGSGVARANAYQDHNPSTLAPLGFLIEEARTNSIRNNTMVGASAPSTLPTNWLVTASGITASVIGIGTESGVTYIDVRLSGTTSGLSGSIRFESATGVAATSGQTWTESVFVRMIDGATTNINTINTQVAGLTGGGAGSGDAAETNIISAISAASIAVNRKLQPITLASGTTAYIQPRITFTWASGVAVDITLRIGLPQLELGAFATSPILTSGAAATRLADSASITGTNFSSIWNAVEGTVVVQARPVNNNSAVIRRFVESSDGTINNRYVIGQATSLTESRYLVVTSGSVVSALNVSTGGSPYRVAAAYKADDFIQAANGTLSAADLGGALPSVDRLLIGFGQGSLPAEYINGHIQSLTYYRKRLSNQTLQTLTA